MLLPTTLLAAAFLIWLLCFVDAWRNKTPHTLFGSQESARKFWIVMLLLANPILVVLYALFARSSRTGKLSSGLRHAIILCVAAFAIWMQLGGPGTPRIVGDVTEHPLAAGWGFNIGRTALGNNSSYGTSTDGGPLRAPRTLRILYADDELSRTCAYRLAQDLREEWWAERVVLWPQEEPLEDGGFAPDFIVNISSLDVTTWLTPFVQTIQGRLVVTGSCSSYPMGSTSAHERLPRGGAIEIENNTTFHFRRFGCALGSSVFSELADGLNRSIRELMTEDFREAADTGHRVEFRPAEIRPRGTEVPAPLAAMDLQPLGREHGPYVHERAWFRFHAEGRCEQILKNLNDALEALGWNPSWAGIMNGERSVLRMDRGGLQVTVGRWPRPERHGTVWIDGVKQESNEPVSTSPFIVTLVSYFTDEEYQTLAETYAAAPMNVPGLLAIHSKIQAGAPLDKLREALRQEPDPEASFWLRLSRLDKRAEDLESATRSLQIAHALAVLDSDSRLRTRIEGFARRIGLHYDPPSDGSHLLEAGFHLVSSKTGTLTRSMAPGEQLRFLRIHPKKPPAQLVVRARSLQGREALDLNFKSPRMGQRGPWAIGRKWGAGKGNWSFHLDSELRDGKIEIRVGP